LEELDCTDPILILFLGHTKWCARLPGPFFHHERGLRQGDPLSSYLFILAIDTLHRLFELATLEAELSELRGRHAKIRLSLYANDAALFLNPHKEEVDLVLQIMKKFGDAIGLKINIQKSSVAAIRCADLNLENILSSFTGQQINLSFNLSRSSSDIGTFKASAPSTYA